MGKQEIRCAAKVSLDKPAAEQECLHNRWHPDVPFCGSIKNGETVKIECVDWTGGQIGNNDSADDVKNVDLTKIHYLTGPFEIETAEPGDILLVEIQDVQPMQDQPWGFTGIFAKENGGGFLDELYPKPAKAIWDFEGIFCSSRHIPGVRFAGLIHPGILGCAPSPEVLETWNTREAELISTHSHLDRDVALPPQPKNVHAGSASSDLKEKVGKEGARTVPGRPEHGGNCDIKNLSRGSKAYLPVFQSGAGLAIGDLHFSQGDGELAFCGAIEMAGTVTMEINILKNGVELLGNGTMPIYLPSPVDPMYSDKIVFQGLGVDMHGDGRQMNMCATTAYKEAAKNCIKFLQVLGYTREQAILLLTAAPVESHVAAIVDSPNACVTMELPKAIFDRDLTITAKGFEKRDYGQAAVRSDAKAGMYTK